MLEQHLAALPIILPLIAAPIALLLGRSILSWGFATLVSGLAFLLSWQLLSAALSEGVISYAVGGWAPSALSCVGADAVITSPVQPSYAQAHLNPWQRVCVY